MLAAAICGPYATANAQEKTAETQNKAEAKEAPAAEKAEDDVTIPDATYKSAATVDFSAELGLSFPSLVSLGSRIERYRSTSPDPFGLASAAKELAAAEKLAGGNASITAEQLMAEAVQMAKVRNNSTELEAIAMLVGDEKVRDELSDLAIRAAKDEKKRAEQAKAGVATRGITSELIVDNDSHQVIRVYYNRRYQGTVRAHSRRQFRIHDHSHHFDLYARGTRGTIWRRHVDGDVRRYFWKIRSTRQPFVRLPSRVRNLHAHVRRGGHVDVEWGRAQNAVSYEIQVYDQRAGRALRNLWKRGIRDTSTHFDVPRRGSGVYEVYVRGINARGLPNDQRSLWSKTVVYTRGRPGGGRPGRSGRPKKRP